MNVTNELMGETIKSPRENVRRVEGKVDEMVSRVRSLGFYTAGIVQSRLGDETRFAALTSRIERIERRLELAR